MEVESCLSSLLHSLKVDESFLRPKTWESVQSESGPAAPPSSAPGAAADLPSVSEASLVRLVINALQGVRTSVVEIERLSESFCSIPADRACHQIQGLWHRSSSTNALGKLLKEIGRSGFTALYLLKFVDYFLCSPPNANGKHSEKNGGLETGTVTGSIKTEPPYSLVNQAFSTAVKKVLEGYICSLDTLSASIKLRRSTNCSDRTSNDTSGLGNLTGIVHPKITVLEVYLHTKELRTQIEALGNICCFKYDDVVSCTSSGEVFVVDTEMGFDRFPRGAKLLSYLYALLRDSDLNHHGLLRFLFARSFEPYCGFIKSWIYKAEIDDPYQEFLVEVTYTPSILSDRVACMDDFCVASIKERDGVSFPFFLEPAFLALFRSGQQLQILIRMLDMCSFSFTEDYNDNEDSISCKFSSFDVLLPCWNACSADLLYNLSSLSFTWEGIKRMVIERETEYRKLWDKLKNFFTDLNARSHQIDVLASCASAHAANRDFPSSALSLLISDHWNFSGSTVDLEMSNEDADREGFDDSSRESDSSYEKNTLQSDSSSFNSYEEEPNEQYTTSQMFGMDSLDLGKQKKDSKIVHITCTRENMEDKKLSQKCVSSKSDEEKTCLAVSNDLCENYVPGRCWPLGGLLRNPFCAEIKCRSDFFSECNLNMANEGKEILKEGCTDFSKVFQLVSPEFESDVKLKSKTSLNGSLQPWSCQSNYDLNANPLLVKPTRFHATHMNERFLPSGEFFSYFDFSSVEYPHKVFSERLNVCSNSAEQDGGICFGISGDQDGGSSGCLDDGSPENETTQSEVDSLACSVSNQGILTKKDYSGHVFGGATWETLLRISSEPVSKSDVKLHHHLPSSSSEIPLDIVIDKCILQEILLQYKYVSKFTIHLLNKGFDLHEHLLALRRYYFMELADWADLFIISLRNQKWDTMELTYRAADMQCLLEMALQRSSCENDPYKERLFIYTKDERDLPFSTTTIDALNFIFLDYRMDWPINIVVSPKALEIYTGIFRFLLQVRLALFSMTEVWGFLKDHLHVCGLFGPKKMKHLNAVLKLRLEIHYFISTLQQYVQSQLSDVSWSKFLHHLKHQVEDVLDIETVHMSYLSDANHTCFLSTEAREIASIIKTILQCALDFRLCTVPGDQEVEANGLPDSTIGFTQIKFSQVLDIKGTFERSLKDLHLCYLKSPKHSDIGICRLWSHLNHNGYYSNAINHGKRFLEAAPFLTRCNSLMTEPRDSVAPTYHLVADTSLAGF